MGRSLGTLFARIGVDTKGLRKGSEQIQAFTKRAANNLQSVDRAANNLGIAFLALSANIAIVTKAFREQEKAELKVAAAIRSTGQIAGFTFKELTAEASKLQSQTIFGDETILTKVTAQLLTFTNIVGTNFLRTQEAVLNLSSVLGTDLLSSALQLGKALNDPVSTLGALSRSGIQFSVAQKDLIKTLAQTNRLAEAQDIILTELEKQYGGQAKTLASGLGVIQQFRNEFGDLLELFGKQISLDVQNLTNSFRAIVIVIKNNIDFFSTLGKTVLKTALILGGLTIAFKVYTTGVKLALIATNVFAIALRNLTKANLVITVLAIAIGVLIKKTIGFRKAIALVIQGFNLLKDVGLDVLKGILDHFKNIGQLIVSIFTFDIQGIKDSFINIKDTVVDSIKNIAESIKENAIEIKDIFETDPKDITLPFENILGQFKESQAKLNAAQAESNAAKENLITQSNIRIINLESEFNEIRAIAQEQAREEEAALAFFSPSSRINLKKMELEEEIKILEQRLSLAKVGSAKEIAIQQKLAQARLALQNSTSKNLLKSQAVSFRQQISQAGSSSKEFFALTKALALADLAVKTPQVIGDAFAFAGGNPFLGAVFAGIAAAAMAVQVAAVLSTSFSGKQTGGAVFPGGTVRVNEGGRPELLSVGGNDFLMMGSRRGQITPNNKLSGAPSGTSGVIVNVFNQPGQEAIVTQTEGPEGETQIDILIQQADAAIASGISEGTNQTSRALESTFGLNRGSRAKF